VLDRGSVAAVDAERLEQVAEAELEAGDARVGLADLGREAERPRRLDAYEKPHRLRQPARALAAGERVGGGAHVVGRLDHGQVDEIDIGADDRLDIGVEVRRRQAVDTDDDDLAVGARPPRGEDG
jgi:hypothetical protein